MAEQKKTLGMRLRGVFAKLRPTWFDKHDVIALAGVASIVKGVAMYSHPLAFITAGVFALAASFMSAQPDSPKQSQPE